VKPLVFISIKAAKAQIIGKRKRTAKGSLAKKASNPGHKLSADTSITIEKIKLP
jgi:hypothetical protein